MGIVNSTVDAVTERQKDLMIKQRILDIKQMKRQRDFQLAMQMATLRDRVYWMSAFYVTMGAVSLARMIHLKQIVPLPLKTVPYVLVPFIIGYQMDYAWGTKGNRIYAEAQKILNEEGEKWWFNRPYQLPELLKSTYWSMEMDSAAKLEAMGKKPEKPWAQ